MSVEDMPAEYMQAVAGAFEGGDGDLPESARVGQSDVVYSDIKYSEASYELMGSKTSDKYHRPECRYAIKIKPENVVTFKSPEGGRGQVYLPCKYCCPG